MTLRFDPTQSVEEVQAALRNAAETAWGADALPEIELSLEIAARALWRVSQEPLEPSDVEP
ncbi:MAG TPA: hypothetical protein VFH48_00420 [Chloroflexota bacterium]|nr:hypothetical protein [Chloroflexota bacterium]